MTDPAGDRLRDYVTAKMAERGIGSVSELSRRAHVSRDTFQAWWRGRPPQRSTAELVARELGVTYADLIEAREGSRSETTVTDVSDLAGLSAAINRLADVLEGRFEGLGPELAEGRRRGRARVEEDAPTPGR